MFNRELMVLTYLGIIGGLHLTATSTTTTLVAAMSLANQDLERYFRHGNATHSYATMNEERIALDSYTHASITYTYPEMGGSVADTEKKARYGEGVIKNVTGLLVHITDADDESNDLACRANIRGTKGEELPQRGIAWVALIRRGTCKFEEKVKNVANRGAVGVIVFNDKPVLALEKMQIRNKTRDITAVLTFQDVGLELLDLLHNDYEVTVDITKGITEVRPINTLNRTSVLFVSVSFIVLMIVSLVWLIFYYIQRFRYLQAKDQQSRNLCSVTKKAIMKIPTKTGKSTDEKDLDSDCCAICIEAYKTSDVIRILPCKHEFHKSCIDPWLIEHRTCPMCKLDVLKFYGYVFLGSEESILEYEADRPAGQTNAGPAAPDSNMLNNLQVQPTTARRTGAALSDLMRSRDFVIDFPRIFVLNGGSTTGTHESLFPARLPERSQSTLSLAYAKDWMNAVTNKLDEQHGLKRIRKASGQFNYNNNNSNNNNMQENLLTVQRSSEAKKRRSHSADGGYSNGYFGRLEAMTRRKSNTNDETKAGNHNDDDGDDDDHDGQSTPVGTTAGRHNSRRNSYKMKQKSRDEQRSGPTHEESAGEASPSPSNTDIKIQINGEGFEF